jgi:Domain of unknown function (DUF4145)
MLVECADCEKPVIGAPKGFLITHEPVEGGPTQRWTLLACEKSHPILVMQTDDPDNEYIEEWDDPWRVYPPQDRPLSTEIPAQLRQLHQEARTCLRAKAYTAAAVMSGRTLEATCILSGVKGRTLQESLAKMRDKDLIDGRLWDWAQTLRTVRNAAAHYSDESISRQDAEDAIALARHYSTTSMFLMLGLML